MNKKPILRTRDKQQCMLEQNASILDDLSIIVRDEIQDQYKIAGYESVLRGIQPLLKRFQYPIAFNTIISTLEYEQPEETEDDNTPKRQLF